MDPREALTSKDVTVRAAAVRQLAVEGGADDVSTLIEMAKTNKSPSVRLYAAAAAADLAMRFVGAAGDKILPLSVRQAWFDQVSAFDPAINPSLLMVLAAIPEKKVLGRLGRMMRDPNYGVRSGAATALRRMAMTGATAGDPGIRSAALGWLAEGRHPPDAILEFVKLIGETGWSGMEEALNRARGAGRPHGEEVERALERLASRRDQETWDGLWVSWGVDVLQPEPDQPVAWWVVEAGRGWSSGGTEGALVLDQGGATMAGAPVRRLWVHRLAEAGSHEALQFDGHTFWRREDKELSAAVAHLCESIAGSDQAAMVVAGWLGDVDGVAAKRLRARVVWRSGALDIAESLLEPLAAEKKPNAEVLWMLAEVKLALGDLDSARAFATQSIALAPKKADWKADAEALRASLGG